MVACRSEPRSTYAVLALVVGAAGIVWLAADLAGRPRPVRAITLATLVSAVIATRLPFGSAIALLRVGCVVGVAVLVVVVTPGGGASLVARAALETAAVIAVVVTAATFGATLVDAVAGSTSHPLELVVESDPAEVDAAHDHDRDRDHHNDHGAAGEPGETE